MTAIKRLLREPLLHFLLLGAGLFLAHGLMPRNIGGETGKIVVTPGQVENMVAGFARTWQRPPTAQELAGLVNDRVREEVYYREALALGLDRDDTVIRRRLRQKMEFVGEDIVAQAQPTDDDLDAYLQAHPESFRTRQLFTFSQVYLDPQKHGEHLARDAAQLRARLNQPGGEVDPAALGDALMLEHSFAGVAESEVAGQFGDRFAAALGTLVPGEWQGPVESGYGVHLVRLGERSDARLPVLADVRAAVAREWTNARRLEANEKVYQELLGHYTVTIEQPKPAEEAKKVAAAR